MNPKRCRRVALPPQSTKPTRVGRPSSRQSALTVVKFARRGKYVAYPTAASAIEYGFAFAILECWLEAIRKKFADDLSLCGSCYLCATSTTASVLHRQVKRCRSGFVSQRRITAFFDYAFHRGGASGAYCPMQGRGAILVLRINLSAGVEQASNRLDLPRRIPIRAGDVAIRGVV